MVREKMKWNDMVRRWRLNIPEWVKNKGFLKPKDVLDWCNTWGIDAPGSEELKSMFPVNRSSKKEKVIEVSAEPTKAEEQEPDLVAMEEIEESLPKKPGRKKKQTNSDLPE